MRRSWRATRRRTPPRSPRRRGRARSRRPEREPARESRSRGSGSRSRAGCGAGRAAPLARWRGRSTRPRRQPSALTPTSVSPPRGARPPAAPPPRPSKPARRARSLRPARPCVERSASCPARLERPPGRGRGATRAGGRSPSLAGGARPPRGSPPGSADPGRDRDRGEPRCRPARAAGSFVRLWRRPEHLVQGSAAVALEIERDEPKAQGLDRRHDRLRHRRIECPGKLRRDRFPPGRSPRGGGVEADESRDPAVAPLPPPPAGGAPG